MEYVKIEINGQMVEVPEPCQDDVTILDLDNGVFNIDKWTLRTGIKGIKIYLLKQELKKFKEDVEQVELFDMERSDYEQKKIRCANIILELRNLEKNS